MTRLISYADNCQLPQTTNSRGTHTIEGKLGVGEMERSGFYGDVAVVAVLVESGHIGVVNLGIWLLVGIET